MSLTITGTWGSKYMGTDPTSCIEMKVSGGGAVMEKSTERKYGQGAGPSAGEQDGGCSGPREARQVKPRLGGAEGLITLLNLQRCGSPVLKLKIRSAEVNASQQPLQGAAAMDGSVTPIHTEEGRPAKLPPPSRGRRGVPDVNSTRATALPARGPRDVGPSISLQPAIAGS